MISTQITISSQDRRSLRRTLKRFDQKKTNKDIFYDLCFCICAPQTTYVSNRKVIDQLIADNFYRCRVGPDRLREMIRGVRFLRKADYLLEAKAAFPDILLLLRTSEIEAKQKREWLVKNVKGLGMKTASHLLRNLGAVDLAILDSHILRFMSCSWGGSKKEYIHIENEFLKIAEQNRISAAELDAYIWALYSGTSWENFLF
jgi:N-glycosylase/DNA lyase